MFIDCPHLKGRVCDHPEAVKQFGERPSPGTCHHCTFRPAGSAARDTLTPLTLSASPRPSSPPKLIEPIPRHEWPEHIKAIADMREPEDKGIGDVIERLLGTGGIAFRVMAKAAWKGCNCERRRDTLNAMYHF